MSADAGSDQAHAARIGVWEATSAAHRRRWEVGRIIAMRRATTTRWRGRRRTGRRSATRRARIVAGVLIVLLLVVAAGAGLPSEVGDGVANGSDVAVRALVGGLVGAALGVGLLLGVRRIGVADETRAGRLDGGVPRDPHDRCIGLNGERVDAPLHPEVPNGGPVEPGGPAEVPLGGTSSGGGSGTSACPAGSKRRWS